MSITLKKLIKSPIQLAKFLPMNFGSYDFHIIKTDCIVPVIKIIKTDCIVPVIKERLLLILVNLSVRTDELVSIVGTPLAR